MNTGQPANIIIPRLWLGNKYAATDISFITANHITVIVNASKDIPFLEGVPTRKYRVPVDDNLEEAEITNMSKWAPEIIYSVLTEYKKGAVILVHCAAGVQRSAAIVAMLLIVIKNMTADEAIRYIKSRRRIAFFPGINFKRAINEFETYYRATLLPLLHPQIAPGNPVV
jgi:atypical dual specificity phosphatase